MKHFTTLSLLIGVAACSANFNCSTQTKIVSTPTTEKDASVEDADANDSSINSNSWAVIHGKGWDFSIPNGWEFVKEESSSQFSVFENKKLKNIIAIENAEYDDLMSFTHDTIKNLRFADATVLTNFPMQLNGFDGHCVTATRDNYFVSIRTFYSSHGAIALHCGGEASFKPEEVCDTILNHFKLY